jgi:hypothetical protein
MKDWFDTGGIVGIGNTDKIYWNRNGSSHRGAIAMARAPAMVAWGEIPIQVQHGRRCSIRRISNCSKHTRAAMYAMQGCVEYIQATGLAGMRLLSLIT